MGSSKHLKQLLNEDQEPFVLKNYIDEKRSLLNKPPRSSRIQTQVKVKRQNSITENFCKNVCFFSLQNSPIGTKSPLFDFSSQSKSPCGNSNTVFVHIPARTAALLLEAALRIQNQSEKQKASKNLGFGFFGSILKKLRRRKKNETEGDSEIKVCVKDILRWESLDACRIASEEIEEDGEEEEKTNTALGLEDKRISDVGLSSSSGWTESIEAKSIDLETSTSRSEASDEEEEAESVPQPGCNNGDFDLCENGSPFRFLLDSVLSPRRRSPEFLSPVTSPNRRKTQVENNVEGNFKKSDGKEKNEVKEYCSPVSVLELELDDNVDEQDEEEEDEDDSEMERSFAFVQKAKLKLLQKLRRFERLAGLDPLDLEKRITENEEEFDEEEEEEEEDDYEEDDSVLNANGKRTPEDMKRLLLDLMNEEGVVAGSRDGNKRCKRLGFLKNAERNMVNKMVEMDFRGEQKEWQKNREQVEETVVDIEFDIFEILVEELSVELVQTSDV